MSTRRASIASPPLAWCLFAAIASARADDPKPAASPLPSDPVFQALLTDGTTASGRIGQIGPEGRVVLVDGAREVAVPLAKLVKLTRDREAPKSPPEGSLVLFPDGDRLRALIAASGENSLEVAPKILGDSALAVPLDAPLALLLSPSSDVEAQETLIHRSRDEPRASAVLWLANDDRQAGDFLGLSTQKVDFQRETGPVELDRSGVVAIGFDPTQVNYPRPAGTYLELTFHDGSRLGATECRVEGGQLVATTRFGATIRPSLADLDRVHVRSEAIVYLSERKEAFAEYVSYVGPHRGRYGRDRNVDGRTLRLGGQPYDHGLGMYARTLLAYRVEPKDRRFQALVGLDDRSGSLGSVVFRVLANGKEQRFASPPMTSRDAPLAVDVDLTGVRALVLIAEFGDRGDVQDFADWAEARVIRQVD